MPQFIFAYHGGKMPETEEDQAREMALWEKWFGEMGPAVVIPGNPVGKSKTVSASGVEDHGASQSARVTAGVGRRGEQVATVGGERRHPRRSAGV